MNVEFFTAILKEGAAPDDRIWCATTPFGLRALRQDRDDIILDLTARDFSDAESIVTVNLTGLEQDLFEAIVDLILKSGLLGKPGVKGKGDAVLFMLTNEALHALARIEREEEAEEEKEPAADT
jgi:hypothetical protein